jgi:hypothetical protein
MSINHTATISISYAILPSSRMLPSVDEQLVTDISGKLTSPISKCLAVNTVVSLKMGPIYWSAMSGNNSDLIYIVAEARNHFQVPS